MTKQVAIACTALPGALLPEYKTEGAAGADISAFLPSPVTIESGAFALIPTGLCFAIPEGFEAQVRPRSGLAAKSGVTVLNAPGTIDSDYRGEVKVVLVNFGKEPFVVQNGDRIAQIVIAPVTQANFIKEDFLDETVRGEGGFGSTGVNV
ncbi:dUTP diphosphatase [Treponema sp. Marseille-Q4132]|uniref:dUTP diphosphatase n=1 Tax=Treponema sp. Marseille-Q4132 TaxID=2766701 RepID=UPI0016530A93|nr:dUTP diphosphatase [Treponema sp. Marseille-Q4132]QNL96973.1 dUTP diphosphatase [Treponema sp. Marseille-Q4132]